MNVLRSFVSVFVKSETKPVYIQCICLKTNVHFTIHSTEPFSKPSPNGFFGSRLYIPAVHTLILSVFVIYLPIISVGVGHKG